jgi:hypothetical protein
MAGCDTPYGRVSAAAGRISPGFNLTTTGKTGIWFRRPRIGKSHKGAHWAEYQAGVVGGAEIATLRPDNDLQKGAGD